MPGQYSCSSCSKTFGRVFNLSRHVVNMHGQRPTALSKATLAAASGTTRSTTTSYQAALVGGSGRQEVDPRPRYDEIVDDSPIFEYGCEVPECERCFRYFNSVEELRKHEEVKISQNFTPSKSSLYTRNNFSILIAYVESWADIILNRLYLEKLLWACRATKKRNRQPIWRWN